jgi:hypothetical protein
MVRAHARARALSVMPGNRRRAFGFGDEEHAPDDAAARGARQAGPTNFVTRDIAMLSRVACDFTASQAGRSHSRRRTLPPIHCPTWYPWLCQEFHHGRSDDRIEEAGCGGGGRLGCIGSLRRRSASTMMMMMVNLTRLLRRRLLLSSRSLGCRGGRGLSSSLASRLWLLHVSRRRRSGHSSDAHGRLSCPTNNVRRLEAAVEPGVKLTQPSCN